MRTYLCDLLAGKYQVAPPVDPDATFEDLGLDSLARAEFGAELQDSLGIVIQEDDLAPHITPTALAGALEARGAAVPR
ncbi:acyl carrier protein [Kitasatospora sp. SolWspMP-SS2h]|uniref:acyl carrier protein n=1 Tax=Kitasatospora sp. SolWspMP-SS2h TaxID=1305729 RepID=UPI000DBF3DA8|nr:acyl carrier protein [Kitasatospora sp. SolWspMP-SS2h]RAJ31781.1 acyl carrier protein [Kitasatospora sp. SolWspMP-SS2h]